jgi:hypothetical protein
LVQDGKYPFNTSSFDATILNGQTGMTVKYFAQNGSPLPSPLPNPFVTGTQNVELSLKTNQHNLYSLIILAFIVNPLPKIG